MYLGAFVGLGLDLTSLLAATVVAAMAGLLIAPRLVASIPQDLRAAVFTYMAVISAMIVCAAGASARAGIPEVFVGALLFYVSDLLVARERFLTSTFVNQGLGLPIYYAAQVVLAMTCSAVAA
jgi:hypothetical protein